MNSQFVVTPKVGQILWCNYDLDAQPEMTGRHMVGVISPAAVNKLGTSIVVPISSQPPDPVEPWHMDINRSQYRFFTRDSWFKCNLVGHVANNRFDHLRMHGTRTTLRLSLDDLATLRSSVGAAIDFLRN